MKKNIVLIGLSGCGKTTVGKLLSSRLSLPFVDMDKYIEEKEQMTVSRIFKEKGEDYFRSAETAAAKELSKTGAKVIATGGGAVLRPENMTSLQKTGVLVFLDRSPDEILKKIDLKVRPLLAQDKNRLYALDRDRRPLYEAYADLTVKGGKNPNETLNQLITALQAFEKN